ncbi:alpha-amylase family glycosyl hydrolase [Hoeflea sp. Naph1]|uniref:alpha-amylase family glycosyl hydrolase n=1 Tax=Hoeflea sp. Naph1 TaxID=3388653 RepID=UPI00399035CD
MSNDENWWRDAVIYQIYPRSFQDSSGDGVGDLPGITSRLDYVASLGVDAIWLSPVFTSPMADMGYDVSNYTDIDPLFGTLADFDALVARAHELGLKLIIDQVLSHTSSQHPWFEESRVSRDNAKSDWYVWANPKQDGSPPNNWPSVFGGSAWSWDSRRRQYYLHNFLGSQPDLNFHNGEVQDALLEVMRFWLERGVDGFRLDTVNFYFHDRQLRDNPPCLDEAAQHAVNPYEMQDHRHSKTQPENIAFLERMRTLTDGYSARMMVGEVGESLRAIEVMAEYTAGTERLHMAYSFDMLGTPFSAQHFRSKIDGFFSGAPDGWPCWSFSNHDVMRHVSRWREHGHSDDAIAIQAAAMLLSFPGSICLYQGEELGQTETDIEFHELTDPPGITFWPDYKGRDGCRTPMVWSAQAEHGGFSQAKPWLPVKAPQAERSVDQQEGRDDSVLAFYRPMIALRKSHKALAGGAYGFVDLPEPVLGLWRGEGAGALLCLFNLSPQERVLTLDGTAVVLEQSRAAHLDGSVLELGPNGFCLIAGDRDRLTVRVV